MIIEKKYLYTLELFIKNDVIIGIRLLQLENIAKIRLHFAIWAFGAIFSEFQHLACLFKVSKIF